MLFVNNNHTFWINSAFTFNCINAVIGFIDVSGYEGKKDDNHAICEKCQCIPPASFKKCGDIQDEILKTTNVKKITCSFKNCKEKMGVF